jgi:hypothetical protein
MISLPQHDYVEERPLLLFANLLDQVGAIVLLGDLN